MNLENMKWKNFKKVDEYDIAKLLENKTVKKIFAFEGMVTFYFEDGTGLEITAVCEFVLEYSTFEWEEK